MDEDNFKVPLPFENRSVKVSEVSKVSTVGRIEHSTKPTIDKDETSDIDRSSTKAQKKTVAPCEKNTKKLASVSSANNSSLPRFSTPLWSGQCLTEDYYLEVLKGGVIIEKLCLRGKSFLLFGRDVDCGVQMMHPSVSRQHVALIYRPVGSEKMCRGFYICDLGSTHGTVMNRKRLQARGFYHISEGDMFSLGTSTRLYILQLGCADTACEDDACARDLTEQEELDDSTTRSSTVDVPQSTPQSASLSQCADEQTDCISWGMREDASEETDLRYNPYAESQQLNEHLYARDPRKALRSWFERHGHELDFCVDEHGPGSYTCSIELPVARCDGDGAVKAVVHHTGKRRDTIERCCLEACRMLDRSELFNCSTNESGHSGLLKRRRAVEEAMDARLTCGSLDDDEFLDRTGDVSRKRRRAGASALSSACPSSAHTHQSLVCDLEQKQKQLQTIQSRLDHMMSNSTSSHPTSGTSGPGPSDEEDELDAYMRCCVYTDTVASSQERRELKVKLATLRGEIARLERLVNLSKPSVTSSVTEIDQVSVATNQMLAETSEQQKSRDDTSGELDTCMRAVTQPQVTTQTAACSTHDRADVVASTEQHTSKPTSPEHLDKKRFSQSNAHLQPKAPPSEKQVPPTKQQFPASSINTPCSAAPLTSSFDTSDKYSSWLPPSNQSGDGRTSLNTRFNY